MLGEAGLAAQVDADGLRLPSGLRLEVSLLDGDDPQAGEFEDGRVVSTLRIVAIHDELFPRGLQEVQHASGVSAEAAMTAGFAAWAQRTLPVLEDALRAGMGAGVQDCDLMNMRLKTPGDGKERVYQAVFGPVVRVAAAPAQGAEDDEPCSFCMATRIQDALAGRLRGDGYTGIRLVAARDAEGYLVADCQVNGEALPEAAARLMAYAQSWPDRGFEVREQYVILRPVAA